jgi:hypothetical protein
MADVIPVGVVKFFIFAMVLTFISTKALSFITLKPEIKWLM